MHTNKQIDTCFLIIILSRCFDIFLQTWTHYDNDYDEFNGLNTHTHTNIFDCDYKKSAIQHSDKYL